jgi:hypothetical protein
VISCCKSGIVTLHTLTVAQYGRAQVR